MSEKGVKQDKNDKEFSMCCWDYSTKVIQLLITDDIY